MVVSKLLPYCPHALIAQIHICVINQGNKDIMRALLTVFMCVRMVARKLERIKLVFVCSSRLLRFGARFCLKLELRSHPELYYVLFSL